MAQDECVSSALQELTNRETGRPKTRKQIIKVDFYKLNDKRKSWSLGNTKEVPNLGGGVGASLLEEVNLLQRAPALAQGTLCAHLVAAGHLLCLGLTKGPPALPAPWR